MTSKIKVMIVDDSALVRQVVSKALARDAGIEVIATASDPVFAIEKLRTAWPDVIVLDIEMPRMDGISFLRKVMTERPTPVIICSSTMYAATTSSGASCKTSSTGSRPSSSSGKPAVNSSNTRCRSWTNLPFSRESLKRLKRSISGSPMAPS